MFWRKTKDLWLQLATVSSPFQNSSMFKIILRKLKEIAENRKTEQAKNPDPPGANDNFLRRSQRQRRPPARLADYVQIIY